MTEQTHAPAALIDDIRRQMFGGTPEEYAEFARNHGNRDVRDCRDSVCEEAVRRADDLINSAALRQLGEQQRADGARIVADAVQALAHDPVPCACDDNETSVRVSDLLALVAPYTQPRTVRADQVPVGTVARVRFPHAGTDTRTYVAEVRTDFGSPRWAGSWHGFTLADDGELEVLEILFQPDRTATSTADEQER